jgi:hypothetical protein
MFNWLPLNELQLAHLATWTLLQIFWYLHELDLKVSYHELLWLEDIEGISIMYQEAK